MQIKINVFQKERKAENGNKFISYSTKNKNGEYHQVRFVMDCVNKHLVPTDKRPFVLVTDTKKVSKGVKKNDDYECPVYYIREVLGIEQYEEVELSSDEFEPLPF